MSSSPSIMNGIVIEETGGVDKLKWKEDIPIPELKDGDVLVKNEYIGVNYIDTYFRTGLYPSPLPLITGKEAAGYVSKSTSPDFKEGDKVAYVLDHAYAEYTVVPAARLITVPPYISTETAAASLTQGLTALTFIREIPVHVDHTVLVLAAAGGVGQWLVQILCNMGCYVIACAGGEKKCETVRALGAAEVIDYNAEDWVESVKEATEGKTEYGGPDVVFDGVGAATFDADMDVVARKGTIAVFGNASGAVPPVNVLRLGQKNVKLMRPVLFGYIQTREELDKYSAELFGMLERDDVKVSIHKVYSLKEVAAAHLDLEERKTMGKLLLKV